MYRLLMAKGKRHKDMMHLKLEIDLYLDREALVALKKAVEDQNATMKKYGWEADLDEGRLLARTVFAHVRELKEQYSEEEKHAEFNGDSNEALPVAEEIRGSEECRQVG